MSKIRVLIVDDHPLMRAGIAETIKTESDMEIAGVAENGVVALSLFAASAPDVSIVDLRMPVLDGLSLIQAIRAQDHAAKIVVLTASLTGMSIQRALQSGASSILLKHMCHEDLVDTIRAVNRGERPLSDDIAKILADVRIGDPLTIREIEVLERVANGKSNREVAVGLAISEYTVKGHVKSIMTKLGASDRTHAVTIAMQRGFLDSPNE